ncbi:dihydrofolate reductase family protein [Patescibacteria group bacterium]
MATTANGFISGKKHYFNWVSKKSRANYLKQVKKSGYVIIGRRTYDVMPRSEFLKDIHYVVFTNQKNLKKKSPLVRFTNQKPVSILKELKKEGAKEICICGGGKLNASFMKEKLIDEMYLDVEPFIFVKGIKLFEGENFEGKLKLLGIKKYSPNTIQLHYQVLK